MESRLSTIIIIFCTLFFSIVGNAATKEPTLKQKIGQMLLIGFKGTELQPTDSIVTALLAQRIGGVVLFDYDAQTKTYDRNIKNPQQLKHLTEQLQSYTKQAATSNHNTLYPLFISIDYEGGNVNRLKEEYGFSKTLSAAELGRGSYDQAREYAQQMAETLQQAGVNIDFAPVLDVNVNPSNPIIGKKDRSFSADPNKVTNYAEIFAQAFHDHGIICVYKHFPGHGSSTGDTHLGLVDVTKTWQDSELNPYKELLAKPDGCPMVMTAHVVHYGLDSKGYPASLSAAITTDLLRKKLKFNGVVITDALQMKAIADNYGVPQAVRLAILAGADILIFDNQLAAKLQDPQEVIDIIYHDVMTGAIPRSRIDESYRRIMNLKKQL
jgi:beta-N-acetylhexosaminidase